MRARVLPAALAAALGAVWLPAAAARALPGGADGAALRAAADALASLRVEAAATAIERLARRHPRDPDVRFERAVLRFYRGDYSGAASDVRAAGDRGTLRSAEARAELGALIRATRDATRGFVTERSRDGRYVVRHAPGPDAILVPYALATMRAADRALQAELGVRVPGPIRVEIYPTASALAQVSSLSVEAIATSGTIALCKFDRLMITSPRALVRGYPWLDTISHEMVHMVLSRATHDRAPVWLQEGVAKFLERRWRGEPAAAHLDPVHQHLLRTAAHGPAPPATREARFARLRAGELFLMPLDDLHPSIALLPTQEAAALGFAEVATFVERFYRAHAAAGLRGVIARIAGGDDAREALAHVAGTPFERLERDWRAALRAGPRPAAAGPRVLRRRLRPAGGEVDESVEVTVARARRHLRIGDMLWARDRPRAAAAQYGRAQRAAPGDPIIASRLARASLEGGQPRPAIEAIRPFLRRYPEHAPAWAISGSAHLAAGDRATARRQLREALRLNPFDPAPHCDLAQATDDDDERRRERAACRTLGAPR